MKKFLLLFSIFLTLFITGCKNDNLKFKEEYENLNGKSTASGSLYRSVTIPQKNPFVYKEASDIVKMIEDKETFVVYFGFAKCPWCRSVLPNLIEAAKDTNLSKIYYVDVLDIRDTLTYDGEIKKTKEGTDDYYKLISLLSNVLERYTITSDGKEIDLGEYRIYAPNVVAIKDGKAISLVTGVSELQNNAYMELTDAMNKESYNMFKNLIKSLDTCNDKTC